MICLHVGVSEIRSELISRQSEEDSAARRRLEGRTQLDGYINFLGARLSFY